jgi:hypothetical protein
MILRKWNERLYCLSLGGESAQVCPRLLSLPATHQLMTVVSAHKKEPRAAPFSKLRNWRKTEGGEMGRHPRSGLDRLNKT